MAYISYIVINWFSNIKSLNSWWKWWLIKLIIWRIWISSRKLELKIIFIITNLSGCLDWEIRIKIWKKVFKRLNSLNWRICWMIEFSNFWMRLKIWHRLELVSWMSYKKRIVCFQMILLKLDKSNKRTKLI